MSTSFLRLLTAAIALLFVAAACASEAGPVWTFAPVTEDAEASTGDPVVETIEDDMVGDTTEPQDEIEPVDEPLPEETEEPAITEAPAATDEPAATDAPAATGTDAPGAVDGEARIIDLLATNTILFTTPDGGEVADIAVTPGETVIFRVDNTAGFNHSFYIGAPDVVSQGGATTDVGTPPWASGVQEIEWVVPDDVSSLEFACTVAGHYTRMHGGFTVAG